MATIRRVLRCQSCKSILQSTNPDKPGYISPSIIENGVPKIPYCDSCYEKMLSLNASTLEHSHDKDILRILKDANATDALIVWVVNLYSFNGTLNPDIIKKVKKLNVVVLGTKFEVFPSFVSAESLKRYIDERFSEYGINPILIELVDRKNFDIKSTMSKINKLRKGHDIYLIGSSGSEKTFLADIMLQNYVNKTKWNISHEVYPGTKAEVLSVPLSNSSFLYKLPNFTNVTSLESRVEKDVLKAITPKKEIDMTRFFLGSGSAIFIGGLAVFTVISGKFTSYRFFVPKTVDLKWLAQSKAEKAFWKMLKEKDIKPISKRFMTDEDFDIFEYDLEDDDLRHDIGIEGLGWVSVRGKGQTIRIMLPKGIALKECLSKVR